MATLRLHLFTDDAASAQALSQQISERGAHLEQNAVTLPVDESKAYDKFLELAKLPTVRKAAVALPSNLQVGSHLFCSPWIHVTITQAERDQHLRRDIWDMMVEYAKIDLGGGKVAYSFPHSSPVRIADLALYVAHSCHPQSVVEPAVQASPEEQGVIDGQMICLDYYGFQEDTGTIDFMAELTYDTYFSLRDYQYLVRLASGSTFSYDTPLYTDVTRVQYGLTPTLEESVAAHRARFPDRPYKNVRIITRNHDGAQEGASIVRSLGFQIACYDDHQDRIFDLLRAGERRPGPGRKVEKISLRDPL